jgi:DNA-binding IclR family transcriptional regulator
MMTEPTSRDRAWLEVIDALRNHQTLQASGVAERAGVSTDTASRVLKVAENDNLIERENENKHTYWPVIGPLGEVEDAEYQRLILDLLAEANKED